jgi:hypothetical protein
VTRLSDRSTGDLLILLLASLVVAVVLISTVGIVIIQIARPDQDTGTAGAVIANIVNTLVGLVAGYLAGKTDSRIRDK